MDRQDLIAEIKKQLLEELHLSEEQKKQLQDLRSSSTQLIKENPWTTVALASLAGFLIARWMYRRGDDK
ncbi:MAG: DUF883 C-terminal domain-containing protein [Bdellovibrio sp.]